MAARQNVGLAALAEAARLVKPRAAETSALRSGPRINAGGRVGKSDLGVRLLTSTDPEEARALAAELDRLNEERRAIEMLVCEQAEAQAAEQADSPVITVMSGGWHQGVIGIVAGRIKERFGRPAIVIAETEDGTGKGSGRSISGVDLGAAVLAAKDSGLLIAGGGHAMAAGLTLPPGGLEPFRAVHQRAAGGDVEKARGDRALLLDALLAPGGVAGALVRCARRRRALWRRLAGPARCRRAGAAAQDRHRRRRPCPRPRLRRRRQDASSGSRSAAPPPSSARRCCRRPATALVARGDDQARRMERWQCGRDAPRGRRACLTVQGPSPNALTASERPHRLAV